MPFYIEIMESGQSAGLLSANANNGESRPVEFQNGRAASEFASAGNEGFRAANSDTRYRVKKIDGEIPTGENQAGDSWRDRERARFESGFYSPVPWSQESWFLNSEYGNLHFPHMSIDHPGKIAFTESEQHGKEDRQLRIRAGRYLQRFFSDTLDGSDIRDYAAQVSLATGDYGIQFATTPDEIQNVYESGPDSCMGHPACRYDSPCHPTRVYGAGDLAIAYITSEDDDIISRVLCWPENRVYSRIYGDGGHYDKRLAEGLEELGYCESNSMSGARMLRIEYGSGFVAPYLDTDSCATDDGEYLIIDGCGYIQCQSTDGLTEPRATCDCCGDSYDNENEGAYIESTDQNVCDHCYSEHYFYCEDCDRTYHDDCGVHIEDIGRTVCDSCASDYPSCDCCGERFRSDSLIHIESEYEDICESCYSRENYFTCDDCGECFPSGQHNNCDGESYCDDCAESWQESQESEDDESEDDRGTREPIKGVVAYSVPRFRPYLTDYDRYMLEQHGQMRLDFFAPGFDNPEPWRITEFRNVIRNR